MIFYLRTYNEDGFTETLESSLAAAIKKKTGTRKIHVCRHDEELPCSLI